MNFRLHPLNSQGEKLDAFSEQALPLLSIEIIHREGRFPRLKILTFNPAPEVFDLKNISLFYGDKCLFTGIMQASPILKGAETVALCYLAQPRNHEEQRNQILECLRQESGIDPLFVSTSHEILDTVEAIPGLIEWGRVSGKAQYCPISPQHPVEIETIFHDSLELSLCRRPYKAIEMEVHAHWMQQHEKVHDISEKLKQDLPDGLISTLTGKSLQKNWWKAGERNLGKHFRIVHSALKEYQPPIAQRLHFPTISRASQDNRYFKRYWFEPELILAWAYQQPRHEVLSFRLAQGGTRVSKTKAKKITLTLNDIVGPRKHWQAGQTYQEKQSVFFNGQVFVAKRNHRSAVNFQTELWTACADHHTNPQAHLGEFFTTDRGKQAAKHALNIAKTHLLASARSWEVRFSCPLEQALHIETTTTVRIHDQRLPERQCVGKVKSYRLNVDGETGEAVAEITLGIFVGIPRQALTPKFSDYTEQRTQIGILNPALLTVDEIVKGTIIKNPCELQEQVIQNPRDETPVEALNKHKTKFQLQLADLQTVYPYQHVIHAILEGEFQPPSPTGAL